MSFVHEQYLEVSQKVAQCAESCGNDRVELLAVSKTFPAENIAELYACGVRRFAESKATELATKAAGLPADIEWHFIGHLQSNKVKSVLEHATVIHTVDSWKLLERIDRIAGELGKKPQVFLEVNVSGEASKFGLSPDAVEEMVLAAQERQLRCLGLMTIAPLAAKPAELGKIFADLRRLRDKLAARTGSPLPELSMGMSGDFLIAIAEGATLVRLGSAVFGHRPSIE